MSAETPKPLLKNLGAKLRQMMAEDWRGEDERNTLGMAGYWLEMLGQSHGSKDELVPLLRELFSELPHPALLEAADRVEILQHNKQSCQCVDRAAVYRDGVPWCINCSAQIILLHNTKHTGA